MKQIRFSIVFCLLALGLTAQDTAHTSKIVSWNFGASKTGEKTYKLSFSASIQKGWKLFSTTMKDDEPNTRIKPDSAALTFISVVNTS